MDSFRDLSETDKRPIRAAYYRRHHAVLTEEAANQLTPGELEDYYLYGEAALHKDKIKETLGAIFGIVLFIGFWVVIIAIGNAASSDSGDTQTHQTSPSSLSEPDDSSIDASETYSDDEPSIYDEGASDGCNPNYDPCVEDSSYDLDCADIGEEVEVTGDDVYNLDRDGDGYGCESY